MPQCDVHFIEKCPICKPHLKVPVAAQHLKVGDKVELQTITTAGASTFSETKLIKVDERPEITDPAAKNMLSLAQEYAQAQDEVTTLRGMVKNLRSHLTASEEELENAVRNCSAKQRALADAVMPQPKHAGPQNSEVA